MTTSSVLRIFKIYDNSSTVSYIYKNKTQWQGNYIICNLSVASMYIVDGIMYIGSPTTDLQP